MDTPDELDLETLAIGYLADLADVSALLDGDGSKVAGRLPRGWQALDRAVRITRTGGTPVDHVGHLIRARLYVEAFGASDLDAYAIAVRVLARLKDLEGQTVAGAVFTATDQDLGLRRDPDPMTEAPRYVFGVVLFAHPAAT